MKDAIATGWLAAVGVATTVSVGMLLHETFGPSVFVCLGCGVMTFWSINQLTGDDE